MVTAFVETFPLKICNLIVLTIETNRSLIAFHVVPLISVQSLDSTLQQQYKMQRPKGQRHEFAPPGTLRARVNVCLRPLTSVENRHASNIFAQPYALPAPAPWLRGHWERVAVQHCLVPLFSISLSTFTHRKCISVLCGTDEGCTDKPIDRPFSTFSLHSPRQRYCAVHGEKGME